MKVLLDTCVWGKAQDEIAAAEHDVIWAGHWQVDPGDEEILAIAAREKRILVTLDKDFGEPAIVRGLPHAGIIRLVNFPARGDLSSHPGTARGRTPTGRDHHGRTRKNPHSPA
jgi:predicted nuclease of predicted toxin-antitoxin system